jgi:hypothetical protein
VSEEKRPRGRPPGSGAKPPGEKFAHWDMRLSPELLERLRAAVPRGKRTEFVRRALERALSERERED